MCPILAGILVMPFMIALRGWVLTLLWGWFMVPLGLVAIGMWHACGVQTLVSFLTFRADLKTNDEEERLVHTTLLSLLLSAMALGFGALYHALMG